MAPVAVEINRSLSVDEHEVAETIQEVKLPEWTAMPPNFPSDLLNPELATTDELLTWLDEYAADHKAINHQLLQKFADGEYGKHHARILSRYLTTYQLFSKKFAFYVSGCRSLTSNAEARTLLAENIDEENGNYDDEYFRKVFEQFGIKKENIDKVSHVELFNRVVVAMDKYFQQEDPVGYQKECEILKQDPGFREKLAEPLLNLTSVLDDKSNDEEETKFVRCLSSLYWGTELIVPKFYHFIYKGLTQYTNLSLHELAFYPLHIDIDDEHAAAMRQILMNLGSTSENRKMMAQSAHNFLHGRVSFYDNIMESVSNIIV